MILPGFNHLMTIDLKTDTSDILPTQTYGSTQLNTEHICLQIFLLINLRSNNVVLMWTRHIITAGRATH